MSLYAERVEAWKCPKGHVVIRRPAQDPPVVCDAPKVRAITDGYMACGAGPLEPLTLRRP